MVEGVGDETGERIAGEGAAERAPSSGGDLEFDEAWAEPRRGDDAVEEPSSQDDVPRFEDPSDR